jgi:6-phosphogluconolactonase (cycloisomerase 2 family)
MSTLSALLCTALFCAEPRPAELTGLISTAQKIECIRHSRGPTFTMIFDSAEDIAKIAKRFDPAAAAKPVPTNGVAIHKWQIVVWGKDRRATVITLFGETKVIFPQGKEWLGELQSKNLHRFLTDRAAELGSPDPLVPSSILSPVQSDRTVSPKELKSLHGHKVLLNTEETDLLVSEDATDALLIYRRNKESGGIIRAQAFQNTRNKFEIDNSVRLDHMEGPYSLAHSPDGRNAYLSCKLSGSVCVFQRSEHNVVDRWNRVQVCIDEQERVQGLQHAGPLAVSPDGRDVYVASHSEALVCFRRDMDGKLTYAAVLSGPQKALKNGNDHIEFMDMPTSIAVSPDGRSVYVTDFGIHGIVCFERDGRSGALRCSGYERDEILNGHLIPANRGLRMPRSVALSPDSKNLYICSAQGTLSTWKRNEDTGALEFVELHTEGSDGVTGLNYAVEVNVVPKANRVCVVGQNSNGFAQFERTTDGRLTFLNSHTCTLDDPHTFAVPHSLAVSSDLRFFYLGSSSKTLTMLGIKNDPFFDRMREPK